MISFQAAKKHSIYLLFIVTNLDRAMTFWVTAFSIMTLARTYMKLFAPLLAVMLNVVMLSVDMLNVVMMSVVKLSVILMSVVAPS